MSVIRHLCIFFLLAISFALSTRAQQTNDAAKLIGQALDIRAQANLQALQNAIANFRAMNDRNPASLEELVQSGLLESMPEGKFLYDPQKGTVSIAADPKAAAPKLPDPTPQNVMAMALDVQAKANLKKVQTALNIYMSENEGQFPEKLEDLVKHGILDKLPPPPAGAKYSYDPKTGKVDFVKK